MDDAMDSLATITKGLVAFLKDNPEHINDFYMKYQIGLASAKSVLRRAKKL